jgi:hypothetical protein
MTVRRMPLVFATSVCLITKFCRFGDDPLELFPRDGNSKPVELAAGILTPY